ncbi:MAG: hypothetical protein NZM25_06400 [Leptospiraceae bacterium]|nr:hypothetical protein [Leptospiraceae bacterium]MDW8306594.1 hypothetical protein [Leptospiraceae bacterium]
MKVAIAHDFIYHHNFDFLILEEFAKIIPEVDILTLHYHEGALSSRLKELPIYEAKATLEEDLHYRHQSPKILKELSKFPFERYDVIITTSPGPMRWIKKNLQQELGKGPFHIAFLSNPFPGLWNFTDDEIYSFSRAEELAQERELDIEFARGIDLALTHSERMQHILQKIYGIKAEVLAPPVSGSAFYPRPGFREYFVAETVFMPGFNAELLFNTFNYLKEKLIICGAGNPDQVTSQIEKNILVTTNCNDIERANYISNAIAVIATDENHHCHLPFEGLRMGRPVLCHRKSTVAEYIKSGEDGIIFEEATVDALMGAVFLCLEHSFDHEKIGRKFSFLSRTRFRSELANLLSKKTPLASSYLRF